MTTPPDPNAFWAVRVPSQWPSPPAEMSVSTYLDIEECPRRWALSHGSYPEIWEGKGYPSKPHPAALQGLVLHYALEQVVKAFVRLAVPFPEDESATHALREMGGYTAIVKKCIERALKNYDQNPRMRAQIETLTRELLGQAPALRSRLQMRVARLRLPAGRVAKEATTEHPSAVRGNGTALGNGVYPEVDVFAAEVGWKGRIDLLSISDESCVITDFKTGERKDAHKFQATVYAVLWQLDGVRNPSGRAADQLILAYENDADSVPGPSANEISAIAKDLVDKRKAVENALAAKPPKALPSESACRYCSVRQLCEEYWKPSTLQKVVEGGRGDVELLVKRRHGGTSWDSEVIASTLIPAKSPVLLRLSKPADFCAGARLRILDAAIRKDPEAEGEPTIVTVAAWSEVYRV